MITDNDPTPPVPDHAEHELRTLVVCTANLCRSPMMEYLLRDTLARRGISWDVRSAGTQAKAGGRAHAHTEKVLAEHGFDLSEWRTTLLTADLVDASDLVITAAEEHRTWVLELTPAAMGKVFPLRQLAHILAGAEQRGTVDAGPSLVDWMAAARTRVQPVPPGSVDLDDPIGRSARHFRRCSRTVEDAVRQIAIPLTPSRSAT